MEGFFRYIFLFFPCDHRFVPRANKGWHLEGERFPGVLLCRHIKQEQSLASTFKIYIPQQTNDKFNFNYRFSATFAYWSICGPRPNRHYHCHPAVNSVMADCRFVFLDRRRQTSTSVNRISTAKWSPWWMILTKSRPLPSVLMEIFATLCLKFFTSKNLCLGRTKWK